MKVKAKSVKGGRLEPFQNHPDNTRATYRESTKLRKCIKKKAAILGTCTHTAGSANVRVQNNFTGEIILHVA